MKTANYDRPGKLMTKVQELLKNDERTLPEIFRATGIPFYWLKSFSSGKYANPSVNRVETLYRYLTGKDLEV